jgi:8-oxo-dGTP diphosphatase
MENKKKPTRVVCAVIERNGRYLCMKRTRSRYSYISEHWEFPGGKVKRGECDHDALLREIREEMQWDIYIGRKIAEFDYEYPDFTTHLVAFLCRCDDKDDFKLLDHLDYQWLSRDELDQLEWTAADRELLKDL